MYEAASEQRNATTAAISTGSAGRSTERRTRVNGGSFRELSGP